MRFVFEPEPPVPELVGNVRCACFSGDEIILIETEEFGLSAFPGGVLEAGAWDFDTIVFNTSDLELTRRMVHACTRTRRRDGWTYRMGRRDGSCWDSPGSREWTCSRIPPWSDSTRASRQECQHVRPRTRSPPPLEGTRISPLAWTPGCRICKRSTAVVNSCTASTTTQCSFESPSQRCPREVGAEARQSDRIADYM
jgi:hypothetical protein